jgi:hypothetical protein
VDTYADSKSFEQKDHAVNTMGYRKNVKDECVVGARTVHGFPGMHDSLHVSGWQRQQQMVDR